jgi:hypothetical protein
LFHISILYVVKLLEETPAQFWGKQSAKKKTFNKQITQPVIKPQFPGNSAWEHYIKIHTLTQQNDKGVHPSLGLHLLVQLPMDIFH